MGATSQEDIDKQHEQAVKLVKEELACAIIENKSEIPLHLKQKPTLKLLEEHASLQVNPQDTQSKERLLDIQDLPFYCLSSRGHVDVTQLQNLVREGYKIHQHYKPTTRTNHHDTKSAANKTSKTVTKRKQFTAKDIPSQSNLWEEVNAAVNNVTIVRPSHDAWGIGKIVLIFCDDFLQDIYELPWWHARADIRQAVQPILEVLGLSSSPQRIVRMLLASLPPGVTIPVHHDTGEWVKYTHRVHVPILISNPSLILFQCGPTNDSLKRVDCTPGHVFEMNNQARHAVSNCSDDYRVHLILDYVDVDCPLISKKPRIRLQAGERILQTRRSIDRLSKIGDRPTPSFMILGAQKAGTTSLYEYMVQHPLIVKARRRETHCLDWRWLQQQQQQKPTTQKKKKTLTVQDHKKHCQTFYYHQELRLHPSCLTGDSTPSYLIDSKRVIPRLKQVFPHRIQFLVMLRNPIARAESHYAMVTSTEGTEAQLKTRGMEWRSKSFAQVVQEELQLMEECGLIPYWQDDHVVEDVFESFCSSREEQKAWERYLEHIPLNTGSYSLLGRGLYALNLQPWLQSFQSDQFLVLKLEDMKERGVMATMERVWHHVGVPHFTIEDTQAKNTREYESKVDPDLFDLLQRFFAPHNKRLQSLLGEEWKDPWTCSK